MTTLGKTAGALFWMFRYLERSENLARLIDAGLRISLTNSSASSQEWRSILMTCDLDEEYEEAEQEHSLTRVVNYLLRDKSHQGSVLMMIERARDNARVARTAITREVWEATNECYIAVRDRLSRQVREADLTGILGMIRQHSALVRGALHGTMLRNDVYNFARIGTFLERSDNTARILDVKYYLLLPSLSHVGSTLDTSQWDMLLRSLSAQRSYRWLNPNETRPRDVARFLILDQRLPRSVLFCARKIDENLQWLARDYGETLDSQKIAAEMVSRIEATTIEQMFETGLHEFLQQFQIENQALASQIEKDYRFNG
ncbi:MAG: alpha-E domain-containing protein [Sphingobium sp.]